LALVATCVVPLALTTGEAFDYRLVFASRLCLVERFFNQIKLYRPVAVHYDKLAAKYLAFFQGCLHRYGCG
jgi:transposase